MAELNLLDLYPQVDRDTEERARTKTEAQKNIALQFGWEYFDKKGICYNGYFYDGRWVPIVKRFIEHYNIEDGDKILDVGCAKGYMLYDFLHALPTLEVTGIDISKYAIDCAPPEVKEFLHLENANDMSMFSDNSFDLVISINAIHSFRTIKETEKAVSEIQRVSKGKSYIVVDSYRNEKERIRMEQWQIAGHMVLSENEWKRIFLDVGYTGDHYWFKP